MKIHHISEAGVSFEIQFGLSIKIWAGEHTFYIWQQTIAVRMKIFRVFLSTSIFLKSKVLVICNSNFNVPEL